MTIENRNWLRLIQKSVLLLFLAFFVMVVLAQANPLTMLPGRDSGFFLYAGNQILKGKLLYLDVWDSKGPGIFYVNALGLLIANGSRWGSWFLEFLVIFSSTLIGYRIAKSEWGHGAAIFGSLVWLFCLNSVLESGNLTEEYSLLFSFLGILIFWKISKLNQTNYWGWALLGAFLSVNFMFRANNIGVIISLMAAFIIFKIRFKQSMMIFKPVLAFILGVLMIFGAVVAFFARLGTLGAMIQASIFYNLDYAGGNLDLLSTVAKAADLFSWGIVITLVGYLAMAWCLIKKQVFFPLFFFGMVNLPVELLLSGLSGRNYSHYFICWLPLIWFLSTFAYSVFAPKVFSTLLNDLVERSPWVVFLAIVILGFNHFTKDLDLYVNSFNRLAFQRGKGVEMVSPLASYIRQNTRPDDTIFVWGADGSLNFLAQRDAPTAFIYYPMLVDSPASNDISDKFYQALVMKKPAYIVDIYARNPDIILSIDPVIRAGQISAGSKWPYSPNNIKEVMTYIESNYFLEKKIDGTLFFKRKMVGN